jgi:hypothetical protein
MCGPTCSAAAATACADASCCISWVSRSVRHLSSCACNRASAEPTAGAVLARHAARSAIVMGACSNSSGEMNLWLWFCAASRRARQHASQLQQPDASTRCWVSHR